MKGQKRKFRRIISVLTVLAMTVCSVPLAAAEPDQEEENGSFVEMADVPENIRALFAPEELLPSGRARASRAGASEERVALRIVDTDDLNSIRVETPDGEGMAKVFSTPVRYENERGEIEFIDTSMKALTRAERAKDGFAYRNAANSFTVEFGETASKGIHFDDAFTFEAASHTDAAGIGTIQTEQGHGKIIYPDVFGSDTRVEYINTENGIKENIILDQYSGQNRFDFRFRSDTHIPLLTENGSNILVADKDDPDRIEYRFLSLYAWDSWNPAEGDGEPSDFRHMNEDLYYELTDNGGGVYTITVVVPEEYLTHPEIVYPVTIDPSVTSVSSNSNAQDTFVSEATPDVQNNGALDYIRFGKVNGKKCFGYHRFLTLPLLPKGASITTANVKFTFRSGQNTPVASSGVQFWALRVTAHQWYESTITWNNQPYGSAGRDTPFTYNGGYLNYVNADITDTVQAWYNGSPNYGIDFTYSNEDYNDYNSVVSSEGDAARAPVLTVNYIAGPTSVALDRRSCILLVGEKRRLLASVYPTDAENKDVYWRSGTPSVATVSDTGVVTAVSPGIATITVRTKVGGKTAPCTIYVNTGKKNSINSSRQAQSNWCWAAASLMVGRHYYRSSYKQEDIVARVKGSVVNEQATLEEAAKACGYASGSVKSFGVTGKLSFAQIKEYINRGDVLYVTTGRYNDNGIRTGGHAVTIYGYSTGVSGDRVYFIDPQYGERKDYLYTQFCDGSRDDRQYDGTVYPK